jgi:hypothetical protein
MSKKIINQLKKSQRARERERESKPNMLIPSWAYIGEKKPSTK